MYTLMSASGTPRISEAIWHRLAACPAPRSVTPLRISRVPSACRVTHAEAWSRNQMLRP